MKEILNFVFVVFIYTVPTALQLFYKLPLGLQFLSSLHVYASSN